MDQNLYRGTVKLVGTAMAAMVMLWVAAFPAIAEGERPLEDFIGKWQSKGNAFGRPAISTISFKPVFEGKFVHLQYAIKTIKDGAPSPAFSGAAYYKHVGDGQYQASWADSEGSIHPITATFSGQALTSLWGTESTRRGRTRYELLDDGTMRITDWARNGDEYRQFNQNVYTRTDAALAPTTGAQTMEKITGIGGVFFRAKNTAATSQWYADNLGVDLPPTSYDTPPWQQEAGPTVYSPFPQDSDYFGDPSQQWMINFRVNDLDAIVAQIRANGTAVEVDPTIYPNGRFARTHDPAGTPIQLWEPVDPQSNPE